ncbi:MAG TPA: YopX family protein [Paenibacillus sp.]|jgi:uncharacterized phage protein (TIGR01671 family)
MSRANKFRGKSKETGQWVYGGLVQVSIAGSLAISSLDDKGHLKLQEIIKGTEGQYSGLNDLREREIYEEDICTAEEMLFPLSGTRTGIVKYHDGSFLLENMDGKDGDYLFSETAETTVIGNIHDNPELLGGEAANA